MSKKFWTIVMTLLVFTQAVAAETLLTTCPSIDTLKTLVTRSDRVPTVFPTSFDPQTQTIYMTLSNDWVVSEQDTDSLGVGHFQLFMSPIIATLGENIKEKAQTFLDQMTLTHQEVGEQLICSYTSTQHTVQATFIAAPINGEA